MEKLFLLSIIGIYFWCVSKKTAYRLFFIYTVTAPVISIARVACHEPLPWTGREAFDFRVPQAAAVFSGYCMPSMEMGTTAGIGTGLFINRRHPAVKILCAAVPIAMGAGLYYIQAADAISLAIGLAAGIIVAILVNMLIRDTVFGHSDKVGYIIAALAPAFVMACVTMTLYYSDIIDKTGMIQSLNVIGVPLGLVISWFIDRELIDFNPKKGLRKTRIMRGAGGVLVLAAGYFGLGLLFQDMALGILLRDLISVIAAFTVYPFILRMVHRAEDEDDDRINYYIRTR